MKKVMCLVLCFIVISLPACSPPAQDEPAESETSFTFTDDLGRTVTVRKCDRVACLIGSFADIWHLAGGTEQIVAAAEDTWRYFDIPLGGETANLGATKNIDLELLIASEPDLILASCNTSGNVELQPVFDELGLTAAYFSVSTFDDYLRMLKICTEITGCEENYEKYGLEVKSRIDAAVNRSDGSEPSVLYIRATGTSCRAKSSDGSVLGEMLRDLGCRNIADSDSSLLENLSLEAIIDADPDHIFVVLQSAEAGAAEEVLKSTLLEHPAWASLTAVREGRFHIMDPTLYNLKPNERWGLAYEQLADILYPA